jgi:hypothetical protein
MYLCRQKEQTRNNGRDPLHSFCAHDKADSWGHSNQESALFLSILLLARQRNTYNMTNTIRNRRRRQPKKHLP